MEELGVGAKTAVVAGVGIKGGLAAAGFSSIGPVAGSCAAVAQAGIGNVVAGSVFAVAQSVAMGGLVAVAIPATIIGGIAAGGVAVWNIFFK